MCKTRELLRDLLFRSMKARTKEEIVDYIKSLCANTDIEAVMESFREWQKDNGIMGNAEYLAKIDRGIAQFDRKRKAVKLEVVCV